MKLSCDVIRDLLPLYAENMVSRDSGVLVEEHLSGCQACASELDGLRKKVALPLDTDVTVLSGLSKNLRRQRVLTAVFVLLATFAVVLGVFGYCTTPVYLSPEEGIESIEGNAEDGFVVRFRGGIAGYHIDYRTVVYSDTHREKEAHIIAYRQRLQSSSMAASVILDVDRVWYYDYGPNIQGQVIAGEEREGYLDELYELDMLWWSIVLAGGGILLLALTIPVRKKCRTGVMLSGAAFCGGTAWMLWMTTGGQYLSHEPGKLWAMALLEGVLLCAASAAGHAMKRMDQ